MITSKAPAMGSGKEPSLWSPGTEASQTGLPPTALCLWCRSPCMDKGSYRVCREGAVIKVALIALDWARFIDQARLGSPRGMYTHGV